MDEGRSNHETGDFRVPGVDPLLGHSGRLSESHPRLGGSGRFRWHPTQASSAISTPGGWDSPFSLPYQTPDRDLTHGVLQHQPKPTSPAEQRDGRHAATFFSLLSNRDGLAAKPSTIPSHRLQPLDQVQVDRQAGGELHPPEILEKPSSFGGVVRKPRHQER